MSHDSSTEETCTLDIISHGWEQTQRLAMRLGGLLTGGELILLEGNLGSGKTTFTQGLALGLDITANINSPTFTLLKEYRGQPHAHTPEEVKAGALPQERPALYHFDLYRLEDPEEIFALGFDDYFSGRGVCVVEWAERADLYWPAEHLRIRLKSLSETKRGLLFIANGAHYCEVLRQLQKMTYVNPGS